MRLTENNDVKELMKGFNYLPADKYEDREQKWIKLALNKLGQLEDIEEELGVDLLTLFTALQYGIFIKCVIGNKNKVILVRPTLYRLGEKILGFVIPYGKRYDKESNYFGSVRYFGDYGKTWALTKEELL